MSEIIQEILARLESRVTKLEEWKAVAQSHLTILLTSPPPVSKVEELPKRADGVTPKGRKTPTCKWCGEPISFKRDGFKDDGVSPKWIVRDANGPHRCNRDEKAKPAVEAG